MGNFDLEALAAASDGFSGAEIEGVVVAALYAAFAAGTGLTTAHLQAEISATVPLAVTRAEAIAEIRAWARGRAVPAGRAQGRLADHGESVVDLVTASWGLLASRTLQSPQLSATAWRTIPPELA